MHFSRFSVTLQQEKQQESSKRNFRMTNTPSVDAVYKIFRQLNRTPRPSHHEDRVALFLTRFAEKLGLEYERDKENNVVIRKPATPGYENAEPIVLLNHMDMVCVAADGVDFDPMHDSIKPIIENGWMRADGTSLGADNGIGLSMALAILQDDTIQHGPLEVLTTTNEEDGMTGAEALSPDFIKGRKVINLDSEEYDSITVAAAGACIQEIGMRARRLKTPLGSSFYDVTITGGLGGHSGVDINKGRANAILLLAEILTMMNKQMTNWSCHSIEGGNAAASIPGSARACLILPEKYVDKMKVSLKTAFSNAIKPYSKTDPDLKLSITKGKPVDDLIAPEDVISFMDTILSLPNGRLKMRTDMPEVVQTSSNLGLLKQQKAYFDFFTHSRSFSDNQLLGLIQKIQHVVVEQDAACKIVMKAPAWKEDENSEFLQMVDQTFQDVLGFRPRKAAMHFVLEAGYYVQKFPGIQIASIGPRIVEPHSPSERVELSTVEHIWQVTIELLKRLAEKRT